MFRGREIAYVDHGRKLLDRLIDMVRLRSGRIAPRLEGQRLTVVIARYISPLRS